MKHKVPILAVLLMACLGIPQSVKAYDFTYTYQGQTLYYTITDSSDYRVSVVNPSYNRYIEGVIIIPDSVENGDTKYAVTGIGDHAFYDCINITSVIIPDGVTSIDSYAFQYCRSLASVNIPDGVTSIGSNAFSGCRSLVTMNIPASVISIGDCAFCDCGNIITISVESGNTQYDSRDNCNAIIKTDDNKLIAGCQNTIIPSTVTSIGNAAFNNCSGLTSIVIPNSITSIGYGAFYGCSSLTAITIPTSVTFIDECTFYNCTGLTSVNIPGSVTSIGWNAFYNCRSLRSVFIPNSVTNIYGSATFGIVGHIEYHGTAFGSPWGAFSINGVIDGDYVFSNELKDTLNYYLGTGGNVTIPPTVVAIGDNAFYGCSGLTSVSIPNSLTSIGSGAFYGCSGLTSISIPNSVYSIGGSAFSGCSGLTTFTVPDSVDIINGNTFYDCRGLTSVHMPNSVTSIGAWAFLNCTSLSSVSIPDSVISIGMAAFSQCNSLNSVTISGAVTSIGARAFSYCFNLTNVVCKPSTPPTMGVDVFQYTPNNSVIQVPCNSVDSYTNAVNWNDYASRIQGMTLIDYSYSFISSNNLFGTVQVGEVDCDSNIRVTATANYGYYLAGWSDSVTDNPRTVHLTGDTTITAIFETIPWYTITALSNNEDYGRVSFADTNIVTYGETVTIEAYPNDGHVFLGWNDGNTDNPRTVIVSSDTTITAIFEQETEVIDGDFIFSDAAKTHLKKYIGNGGDVVIPSTTVIIEDSAFYNNSHITSVTIPNSVKTIGHYVFSRCRGMNSVDLGDSITSIGGMAFEYCSGLTTLTFPSSLTSIGGYSFYACTGLTSLFIPRTLTSIGYIAFCSCSGLTSIVVEEGNPIYDSRDNCNAIITKDGNCLLRGCENTVIPNSVNHIGDCAFDSCSISSIVIPNSVMSIGSWAFAQCGNLTSLTIPNQVTYIGSLAFNQCRSMTSLTIPSSVTDIRGSAFGFSGPSSVYFKSSVPPTIHLDGYLIFGGVTIHVRCGSEDVYKNALNWNTIASQIKGYIDIDYVYSVVTDNFQYGRATADGPDCDSNLTAMATAKHGYQFTSWGDGNLDNPRTLHLTSDTTLIAFFEPIPLYSITAVANDSTYGWVESGTDSVLAGETVTLWAYPNEGYHFVNWSDGDTDNPRTIQVTNDTTLTALFELNTYMVSVSVDNEAQGTVTGDGTYFYGDTVTIAATPSEGHEFLWWSNGSTDNPFTFRVIRNTSLSASFIETNQETGSYSQMPYAELRINEKYDSLGQFIGDTFYCNGSEMMEFSVEPYIPVQYFNGIYTVEEIPYSPADTSFWLNGTGTRMPTDVDDQFFQDAIQIPFPFYFFGLRKNQFHIGENGVVTFTNNLITGGSSCPYSYTSPIPWQQGTFGAPNSQYFSNMHDAIYGVYEDLYMGWNGQYLSDNQGIFYDIQGDYPTRKVVVTWNQIPVYNNPDNRQTYQIVFYEATNIIEVHVKRRGCCAAINGGAGVIGIQNATGQPQQRGFVGEPNMYVIPGSPAAFFPAGYNITYSPFMQKSFRFTPQGMTRSFVKWYRIFDDGRDSVVMNTNQGDTNGYFLEWDLTDSEHPTLTKLFTHPTGIGRYVCELRFQNANNDLYTVRDTVTIMGCDPLTVPIYTLTVNADSTMGTTSGSGTYTEGTIVTVQAYPNNGYQFTGWSDGVTYISRAIPITSDTTITANFEAIPSYSVVAVANDSTYGWVEVSTTSVLAGETVTLWAYPNEGYHFVNWSDGSTDNPRYVTMTTDTVLTAYFEGNDYCTPNPTSRDNQGLTGIAFGGMVNDSIHPQVKPFYGDYTAMQGSVAAGTMANIDITYTTGYTYGTVIWVDWNKDKMFEENEIVYSGMSTNAKPTTLAAQFYIPASTDTGRYRMRIAGADSKFDSYINNNGAAPDPCFTSTYAAAEDYTLVVTEPPACLGIAQIDYQDVTSNSATLVWRDENTDPVTYSIYNMADRSLIAENISDTSYEVTSLQSNTVYTFGIGVNCLNGDSISLATVTFRTRCEAISVLPWSDGFEEVPEGSYQMPYCWERYQSAKTITDVFPYSSSYSARSGNRSLYFVGNTLASYPDTVVAILPELDTAAYPMGDNRIVFWARMMNSTYDRMLYVGTVSDPSDMNTFTLVDSVLVSGTDYRRYVVPMTGASDSYVALMVLKVSGDVYLDDLTLEQQPTCPDIRSLAIDNQTASSVTVSWSGDSAYSYEVELSQNSVSLQSFIVGDTIATFGGLLPDNDYQVRVRTVCDTSHGVWSEPLDVHIGYCLPNPTSRDDQGITAVAFGGMVNDSLHPQSKPYYGNYTAMQGNVAAGTTVQVDITYQTGYTYGTVIWVDWNRSFSFEDDEIVYRGEAAKDKPTTLAASFYVSAGQDTGLYRMRIAGADSHFDSYITSGGAAPSPCFTSTYAVSEDYTLHVTEAASCLDVASVTVGEVTSSSVALSWVDEYPGTRSYTVTVYAMDEADETLQLTTDQRAVTVTGLLANTRYTFGVQAICPDGDSSASTGSGQAAVVLSPIVRTECGAISALPWSDGFEEVPEGNYPMPDCWERYQSAKTITDVFPFSSSYSARSGNRSLWFVGSTLASDPDTMVAILPELDTAAYPMGDNRIVFWARMGSSSTNDQMLYVGTVSDPADMNTFTLVDSVLVSGTDYRRYVVPMTGASDSYVALMVLKGSVGVFLDDLTLERQPACPEVTSLAVGDIYTDRLDLWWVDTLSQGATYTVLDMATMDTIASGIAANTYTVTGLAPNTRYTFGVRIDCTGGETSFVYTVDCRTACASEAFPFVETFDATLSDNPCWAGATGVTAEQVFGGEALPLNPGASLWTYSSAVSNGLEAGHYRANIYGTNRKRWLVTPNIDLTDAPSAQLRFDAAFTVYDNSSNAPATGFESNSSQAFMVLVSTDGGETWPETNAVKWQNEGGDHTLAELASSTYVRQFVDLQQYVGQVIRIAFYAQSTEYGGDNNIHIDNIVVDEKPDCGGIDTTVAAATACDSYDWNGETYTESGDYSYSTINAAGCDSVAMLRLTVHRSSATVTSAFAYDYCIRNGQTYTESGTYTQVLTNAAGCDSTVTLHLNIVHTYNVTIMANDSTLGTCSSGGRHAEGLNYFTAIPYAGSVFTGWSTGSTDNPVWIDLTSDTTLVANFAIASLTPDTVVQTDTVVLVQYDTVTLTQTDTVVRLDTVTVTEHVHDTTYVYVHDTTYVDVHDTTYITVHDTTYVNIHDTTYVNVHVHDTTYVDAHDTTYVNVHDTTYVNVYVHDTTYVDVHDTTYISVPVHDTTYIDVHDTTYVDVHDTTYVDVIVHDTTYINVPVHDTTYVNVPVHDTTYVNVPVHDTTYVNVPVHDTTYVNVPVHDTTVVTDTVTLTEYVHDTTYVNVLVHDTTIVTDTVTEHVHDTTYVYVHDTTYVDVHDTTYITVHDTTYVNIHDTTYVNVHVHDTTYVDVHDTTYVNVHDTTYVNVYVHDTTYVDVHDTTYISVLVHDTTYVDVHDTTYVDVHDTTYVDVIVHDTTYINVPVHDTTYINVPVHDTTYVNVPVHDTTYVNVPVHDTTYVNVPVHDTTYVNVPSYDTTYVTVYDTTAVYDTTSVTVYDTTAVYDTTSVTVYDTTAVYDTTSVTVYDTTAVYDTTSVTVYDTAHVTVNDTTHVTINDTTHVTVYDTTYVNTPVYDTTYVEVAVYDTNYVEVPVYDTTIVVDTVINTVIDTIETIVYDTTIYTDTLWMYDTVYIHDTIYISDQGIDDVTAANIRLYQRDGYIVVEDADGGMLPEVVIYDAVGRKLGDDSLGAQSRTESRCSFSVPASGVYLIKVGDMPARRVVVVR